MRFSRPGFSLQALRACASGSVLLEFAFVGPLLVMVLIGSNELTRLMRARQHMEDYAITVANDVAATAVDIPAATLRELIERIGLLAPELIDPANSAWNTTVTSSNYLGVGISMAMARLTNKSCHTNCAFESKLAWSFGNFRRTCGVVTMPAGATQEGPVVIVDVNSKYTFRYGGGTTLGAAPTLSTTAFQPLKNWPNSNAPPAVTPTSSGNWNGTFCPNF